MGKQKRCFLPSCRHLIVFHSLNCMLSCIDNLRYIVRQQTSPSVANNFFLIRLRTFISIQILTKKYVYKIMKMYIFDTKYIYIYMLK